MTFILFEWELIKSIEVWRKVELAIEISALKSLREEHRSGHAELLNAP
jgi:hypothetical protein